MSAARGLKAKKGEGVNGGGQVTKLSCNETIRL
jgi:hypothetical protein